MRIAIIGTGFLGEELAIQLKELGHTVVPTHHRNQKYPESIQYDFFY
ncbi:MAG: NAD(P)-binding domain-containing protein [Candidatus Moraniibacteriota bacterium]